MSQSEDALLNVAKELFIHFAPNKKAAAALAQDATGVEAKSQELAKDFAIFVHHLRRELTFAGRSAR